MKFCRHSSDSDKLKVVIVLWSIPWAFAIPLVRRDKLTDTDKTLSNLLGLHISGEEYSTSDSETDITDLNQYDSSKSPFHSNSPTTVASTPMLNIFNSWLGKQFWQQRSRNKRESDTTKLTSKELNDNNNQRKRSIDKRQKNTPGNTRFKILHSASPSPSKRRDNSLEIEKVFSRLKFLHRQRLATTYTPPLNSFESDEKLHNPGVNNASCEQDDPPSPGIQTGRLFKQSNGTAKSSNETSPDTLQSTDQATSQNLKSTTAPSELTLEELKSICSKTYININSDDYSDEEFYPSMCKDFFSSTTENSLSTGYPCTNELQLNFGDGPGSLNKTQLPLCPEESGEEKVKVTSPKPSVATDTRLGRSRQKIKPAPCTNCNITIYVDLHNSSSEIESEYFDPKQFIHKVKIEVAKDFTSFKQADRSDRDLIPQSSTGYPCTNKIYLDLDEGPGSSQESQLLLCPDEPEEIIETTTESSISTSASTGYPCTNKIYLDLDEGPGSSQESQLPLCPDEPEEIIETTTESSIPTSASTDYPCTNKIYLDLDEGPGSSQEPQLPLCPDEPEVTLSNNKKNKKIEVKFTSTKPYSTTNRVSSKKTTVVTSKPTRRTTHPKLSTSTEIYTESAEPDHVDEPYFFDYLTEYYLHGGSHGKPGHCCG